MPAEFEVPTEHLHEAIHERVHGGHHHSKEEGWTLRVAVTAAFLAALAAISALFAGHFANEALLEQIEASDNWAHYQSKSIKSYLFESRLDIMKALGKPDDPKAQAKIAQYAGDKKEIMGKARGKEKESRHHLKQHVTLSKSVTFFQVAIAVAALTVLTRRRELFILSLLLGAAGAVFLAYGLVV